MAVVEVAGYAFAYPATGSRAARPALENVVLSVEEGAFCVLSGPTGCGKTTLLRSLKPELAPVGEKRGSITVLGCQLLRDGCDVAVDARFSAARIGYVMQDPGAQIVTDTVWHELAFGLESLGCEPNEMRRRVAEVAHFFGIEPWVHRATENLSGGQKQLVNLAGALALRPRLLLLDEPTAQLDPYARRQFAQLLGRVNRELNITVVMATHAPEEVADFVTQQVAMGPMAPLAPRAEVERRLLVAPRARWEALCAAADGAEGHAAGEKRASGLPAGGRGAVGRAAGEKASDDPSTDDKLPEGAGFAAPARGRVSSRAFSRAGHGAPRPKLPPAGAMPRPGAWALIAREAYVRYGKNDPWVLRGVNVAVRAGGVHAFVGGNGCGKSTLLRLLAGVAKPQRGSVENALTGAQALLPQDPKALLVCDTVAEELAEWRGRCGYTPEDERAALERAGLSDCADRHPYDLSGGQQQKLALAKVLLARPQLLLLDEPTKGLDAWAAAEVVRTLRALASAGRTVVVVTHDLDFALACADEVSLVFDGELACTEPSPRFFADNLVYRPSERARLYGALLAGEKDGGGLGDGGAKTGSHGLSVPDAPQVPEPCRAPAIVLPASREREKKGASAVRFSPESGTARQEAPRRVALWRGVALEVLAVAGVPLALGVCTAARVQHAALLSFAVVLAALALFFARYERAAPRLRDVMPTVVLAACAAAGRVLFGAVPDFKPVSAIAIIAGAVFGRQSGFMTGALAALVSNFFLGQGPWTPWQMYAWGLVGYVGGVLAWAGAFSKAADKSVRASTGGPSGKEAGAAARAHESADAASPARPASAGPMRLVALLRQHAAAWPLYLYGFVSGPLYGLILNLWSIIGFYHPQTAAQLAAVYAAALPFDLAHGAATVVFLLVLYAPWHRKLARVRRVYGLR